MKKRLAQAIHALRSNDVVYPNPGKAALQCGWLKRTYGYDQPDELLIRLFTGIIDGDIPVVQWNLNWNDKLTNRPLICLVLDRCSYFPSRQMYLKGFIGFDGRWNFYSLHESRKGWQWQLFRELWETSETFAAWTQEGLSIWDAVLLDQAT